jgi:4-hydroxybenzoate polyprenyltransferase
VAVDDLADGRDFGEEDIDELEERRRTRQVSRVRRVLEEGRVRNEEGRVVLLLLLLLSLLLLLRVGVVMER